MPVRYPERDRAKDGLGMENAPMLTCQQVADYADVSLATVYTWIKRFGLDGKRLGDSWRVPASAITNFAVCTGGEQLHGMERLLTIEAAAPLLTVTPLRLQRLAAAGRFPAVRLGKLWRVTARTVAAFIAPSSGAPPGGDAAVAAVGVDRLPHGDTGDGAADDGGALSAG